MGGSLNDSPGSMFRANAKNRYNAVTPLPYAHGKDKDPQSFIPTQKRIWVVTLAITVFVVYIVLSILSSVPEGAAPKVGVPKQDSIHNQAEMTRPGVVPSSPSPNSVPKETIERDHSSDTVDSEKTTRPAYIPSHWLDISEHKIRFPDLIAELDKFPLDQKNDIEYLLTDYSEENFKELGIRTRAFKKIFERWERLHIAYDTAEQRPVQPPWVFEKFGSFIPGSRVYEQYRSLIHRFTEKYYSFIRPRYSNLLDAITNNQGRGMVISCGNHHVNYLLVLLPYMREALGLTLPVEVLYMGEHDLSAANREKLEQIDNVHTVNLYDRISDVDNKLSLAGWAIKPIALFSSSFQETLFLDADVVFLKNPRLVFEEPQYKSSGSLFFTDRSLFPDHGEKAKEITAHLVEPLSSKIKENAYFKQTSGHAQESGVLAIHKPAHLIEFLTVVMLNGRVRDKVTYKMFFGDKETFWFGYELSGVTNYEFQRQPCGSIGPADFVAPDFHAPADVSGTICAPQLLHFDYDGNPFWFNGWIMKSKFVAQPVLNKFEAYVQEPGTWQLFKENVACLSTKEGVKHFSPEEQQVLDQIQKYYDIYYPKS